MQNSHVLLNVRLEIMDLAWVKPFEALRGLSSPSPAVGVFQ